MQIFWIICFIIAVVFIGLEVRALLSTRDRSVVKIVKMVLYLAVSVFTLYLPVFFLQNNTFTALAADLINVMRVISLDAGYLDNKEFISQHIGTGLFYRLYMAALGLLHLLMPLLSIMAIYSIFFMLFSHIRVLFINLQVGRPVFIFNTADDRAVQLASDIQKKVSRGALIFAGIRDKSDRGDADLLNGTIIHPDSIGNIRINRIGNRDIYYFLLSEDEDANIKEALDLIGSEAEKNIESQRHIHIFVAAESNEADSLIDSCVKGEVDVHIIRSGEVAVHRLLEEHPLYEAAEGNIISVLVFGLDAIGEAFVRAASWCGQGSRCRLKINVVGIGIADKISDFRFQYPGYADSDCLELNFYDCGSNQEAFDTVLKCCKDTTYAVITQGTDMQNTETAIRLRRELLKQDDSYSRIPQIYVYIRSREQADVVNSLKTSEGDPRRRISYRLESFGCAEDIFTYDSIMASESERLGINVYLECASLLCDGEPDIAENLIYYNMLEVNKRSNAAYAMHIRTKLAELGLDYTRDTEAKEADFASRLTDEMLEVLMREEHNRWKMFMISDGWTGADMEELQAFKASGLSIEQYFCPMLKMHPCICPYEELKIRSEYLGAVDAAIYDRGLILKIPDILHDRMGVTGVRYKIIEKGGN